MKIAVLFSGGKDSTYSIYLAKQLNNDIKCLISMDSKNKYSYLFHTPTINMVEIQSKLMKIPLIARKTSGEKEKELEDLKTAIRTAQRKFGIEGIVTGAIRSTYQSTRFERVCNELGIWCFNPLWLNDKIIYDEIEKMDVIISGVSAYPLDEKFIGMKFKEALKKFPKEINKTGEGGEFETLVLDAPMFEKKIVLKDFEVWYENYSGRMVVKKFELVEK